MRQWLGLFTAALLVTGGCSDRGIDNTGPVKVTATIAQVADLVRNVGGEHVVVEGLMGEGVDPHLYKASQGDISKLSSAEIIFYSGLMLEGRMTDIFVKMAGQGKPTIPVSDAVSDSDLAEPEEFEGHYDPHVWMDAAMWSQTIPAVVQPLSELRPQWASDFEANGEAYKAKLMELHEYAKAQIASIPKEQRVLVTAHDAFGYFGSAYDIEVMGLQGISTVSEMGLQDLQTLVDILVERKIKAVFVESSVPRRNIEALIAGCEANGHDVVIGGELFSDAMGAPGTPEGTYEGMFKHNVDTIVNALK